MKNNERLANLALAGLTLAPLVVKVNPTVNVISTACLTVYAGCQRSVKPTPPTETISNEHAMLFPLVGSALLLSLFLLFKFLSKDLVNDVLTCYFFVLGIAVLGATLLPAIKRFLPDPWNDNVITICFPYFQSLEIEFTKSQIVAAIPGTFFCVWYAKKKHCLANNILGLAFSIQGVEMLSLGSFNTGAILLREGLPIFKSAFLGYAAGLVVTIIMINWFQAAQPALLRIVPGVIGLLAAHCMWSFDVKPVSRF